MGVALPRLCASSDVCAPIPSSRHRFLRVTENVPVGSRTSVTQLEVKVIDANDPPVIVSDGTSVIRVFENVSVGEDVGTIVAHDDDIHRQASPSQTLEFVSLEYSDAFVLDRETGIVQATSLVDFEDSNAGATTVNGAQVGAEHTLRFRKCRGCGA